MIGKLFSHRSFHRVLSYVSKKPGAVHIAGNLPGNNLEVWKAILERSADLNPIQKPAYHVALSVAPPEHLSDEQWSDIAQDYLDGMQMGGSPWIAFRHTDREHDHIHLVVSRIQLDTGKDFDNDWDYYKSQSVIRSLEAKYDLTPSQSSWEAGHSAMTQIAYNQTRATGNIAVQQQLQDSLDQFTTAKPTLPDLVKQLQEAGIQVTLKPTPAGKLGISYLLNEVAFSGSQLGKHYTIAGLTKHKGVKYDPAAHDRELALLMSDFAPSNQTDSPAATAAGSLEFPPINTEAAQKLLVIAANYFTMQMQGRRSSRNKQKEQVVLWDEYRLVFKDDSRHKTQLFQIFSNTETDRRKERLVVSLRRSPNASDEILNHAHERDARKFNWLNQWMEQQPVATPRTRRTEQQDRSRRRRQQQIELI